MSEGSSNDPYGSNSPPPGPPPPPPPLYNAPPPGYNSGTPTSDDKTWAMLSHLGTLVLGFIAPLVIMLTKGKESEFVRDQSVEALNFAITLAIVYVVSIILTFVVIGIFTFIAAFICHIVFAIMGSMAAYRGERYRYPINIRLVK
jgi:uncharacterized Tic20 family protein